MYYPHFTNEEPEEFRKIVSLPNVTKLGLEPRQSNSEHLQKLLASNVGSWADVSKLHK